MKTSQNFPNLLACGLLVGAATACSADLGTSNDDGITTTRAPLSQNASKGGRVVNTGSRILTLENTLRFSPIQPGSDADRGRRLFGLTEDLQSMDTSESLFEGFSFAAMREIESNGRACFTCHRGQDLDFGMPVPPLSDTIPLDDPIFTGLDADAQGDPDGFTNMNEHGLFVYRPGRFNPQLDDDDGLKQVFFWRKSPRMINLAFNHGFLMDGRMRVMFETARGAIFSHTQESDDRFDDLVMPQDGNDMEAFLFAQVSDERLLALRDPTHPEHEKLKSDPFYTVDIQTDEQRNGSRVFQRQCMSCHNTPNVFSNLSNIEPLGTGRPPTDPTFGPGVGRMFNIGVSERNKHGLRFTRFTESGFEPIVMELAAENSPPIFHTVEFDVGLAASTGRAEDLGRFKVPQLRGVSRAAPYFHDNSADTLEEAVDYHLSDFYQTSRDGSEHPIVVNSKQREDLLEFLRIL
jgi:hypothetical protein